jgi:hypothetical protein
MIPRTTAIHHRCGDVGADIADRKAQWTPAFLHGPGKISRLLGYPGTIGVLGHADDVDATARDLDEEHVDTSHRDGVDAEEVAGDHALLSVEFISVLAALAQG